MKIYFPVIAVHALIVVAAFSFTAKEKIKRTHVKLRAYDSQIVFQEKQDKPNPIEQVASLPSQIEEIEETEAPSEILEEVVEKKPTPTKKTASEKKPVAPVIKKKNKPAAAKKTIGQSKPATTANPNKKKLYALMQESLKNLDKTASFSSHAKKSPSNHLPTLASEALKFEASYQDALVDLLEDRLSFPEKGSVKIKLTLKKEGNFKNLEILHSTSEKNGKYLRQVLENMIFPSLQKFFPKEETHTFLITLTSEKSH